MNTNERNGINKRITESIPEYFFVYDIEKKKITYLTDSFRKYIKEESATNIESIKDTIHPRYHLAFDSLFSELRSGRTKQDIDLKTTESGGMPRWVNFRTFPINSHKIAGHISDVTELKRKEEQMQRESDKQEIMLHMILHELRSPVANIREFSRLLQEALDMHDYKEVRMYAEIMQRLSLESGDIITSLSEIVEMETPDFSLKFSRVNLREIIEQVVENYSVRQSEKDLQIDLQLPENALELMADQIKIRLVIQNLISNAIKFTPNGGHILVSGKLHSGKTVITVKDSGIGIPAEKQDEIFEQFTRMKRKGTNGEKSTGLGLSLAKKIVELHAGQIEVESSPGSGSSFSISLPIDKEVAAPMEKRQQ